MHTIVTFIILAVVASSCLKRRQVTGNKEPAAGSGKRCPAKTKLHKSEMFCVIEDGKPRPEITRNQDSRCGYPRVQHSDGYCALGAGATCPTGEERQIIRNEEVCVEKPDEEDTTAEDGEDTTAEEGDNGEQPDPPTEEEQQPLLAGITAETKLNTINFNARCVGGSRCFHPQAKELVCQAHCAKSALGMGYTGAKILTLVKVDNNGNIKNNSSTLCDHSSGATLNDKGNALECYLAKGGVLFGWGSYKINSDSKCDPSNNKCPFIFLTTETVGKKYMCVESLNTDSDPKQNTNKNYLKIHNKKCDTIEGNNPKLQLEFGL